MSLPGEFGCSLDRLSKIITAITCVGLPVLYSWVFLAGEYSPDFIPFWFLIGITLSIPVISYSLSPRSVGADQDGLWIRRRFGLKKIMRKEILDVRLPDRDEMRGTIRTFGNGGLFGYTGYFRNSRMGSMLWFCTRRSNYVLVVRASGPVVVITPDDPEGFVAYYHTLNAA